MCGKPIINSDLKPLCHRKMRAVEIIGTVDSHYIHFLYRCM